MTGQDLLRFEDKIDRLQQDRDSLKWEIDHLRAVHAAQCQALGEVAQDLDHLAQHLDTWKSMPLTVARIAELAVTLRTAIAEFV